MKFVAYLLWVLFLLMIRCYAHEREIFIKKYFIFIMAISLAYMSPCILLAMLVLKL
jgi:hypothetical protein